MGLLSQIYLVSHQPADMAAATEVEDSCHMYTVIVNPATTKTQSAGSHDLCAFDTESKPVFLNAQRTCRVLKTVAATN
jgi:hypothetical protein